MDRLGVVDLEPTTEERVEGASVDPVTMGTLFGSITTRTSSAASITKSSGSGEPVNPISYANPEHPPATTRSRRMGSS